MPIDITDYTKLLGTKHERILKFTHSSVSGTIFVGIHNTMNGPAFGGCRMLNYASEVEAVTDVALLSEAMTHKAAISRLPVGGGKMVIMRNEPKNDDLYAFVAEVLDHLNGDYYSGEDVNFGLDAVNEVALLTKYMGGSSDKSGNPSAMTAKGVYLGIKESWRHAQGRDDIKDVNILVQGLGEVGWRLCELLHKAGAKLFVTEVDKNKGINAGAEFGAVILSTDTFMDSDQEIDIYAPCALGKVITPDNIDSLKYKLIAGCANNQLSDVMLSTNLSSRNIYYAVDYVINAGGLINITSEYLDGEYDINKVEKRLEIIKSNLNFIFSIAERHPVSTVAVAHILAEERINTIAPVV